MILQKWLCPFFAFLPDKKELGDSAKKLKLHAACFVIVVSIDSLAGFEIGAKTVDLGIALDSTSEVVVSLLSELLLGRIGVDTSGDGSFL